MTDTIVYIGTTNDSSGNPRRGWIIGYGSRDAYFHDEGYGGAAEACIRNGIPRAAFDVPLIAVTPKTYRTWKHRSKDNIALRDAIVMKLRSNAS